MCCESQVLQLKDIKGTEEMHREIKKNFINGKNKK